MNFEYPECCRDRITIPGLRHTIDTIRSGACGSERPRVIPNRIVDQLEAIGLMTTQHLDKTRANLSIPKVPSLVNKPVCGPFPRPELFDLRGLQAPVFPERDRLSSIAGLDELVCYYFPVLQCYGHPPTVERPVVSRHRVGYNDLWTHHRSSLGNCQVVPEDAQNSIFREWDLPRTLGMINTEPT